MIGPIKKRLTSPSPSVASKRPQKSYYKKKEIAAAAAAAPNVS